MNQPLSFCALHSDSCTCYFDDRLYLHTYGFKIPVLLYVSVRIYSQTYPKNGAIYVDLRLVTTYESNIAISTYSVKVTYARTNGICYYVHFLYMKKCISYVKGKHDNY